MKKLKKYLLNGTALTSRSFNHCNCYKGFDMDAAVRAEIERMTAQMKGVINVG